jgi:hypothetical protein
MSKGIASRTRAMSWRMAVVVSGFMRDASWRTCKRPPRYDRPPGPLRW